MKSCSKHSQCFLHHDQWLYKLPDPFRHIHYMPLDSKDISTCLKISRRSALRVCCGERILSHAELMVLQIRFFGYIPEPSFFRYGFHIKDGTLRSYQARDLALGVGEIVEFSLLRDYYVSAAAHLEVIKKRLHDLENPKPPEPTNIIQFSDFKR